MKINFNPIRTFSMAGLMLASSAVCSNITYAQNPSKDTIVYSVPPQGTRDEAVLASAPSPCIKIADKTKTA